MSAPGGGGRLDLAIVGPYPADPNVIRNGVEAVVVYLTEGLRQVPDLRIQVISVSDQVASDTTVERDSVVFHYLRSTRRLRNLTLDARNRARVRRLIARLQPDLIHVHGSTSEPYLSRPAPCPRVTTVHGVIFEEVKYDRGKLDWLRRGPRRLLERLALRHATDLIAVTDYVRSAVRPLTAARIIVIDNPVASRYFELGAQGDCADDSPSTSTTVLFAGGIMPRKNLLDLIRAVDLVRRDRPDVELRMAGGIQDRAYFGMLERHVMEHDLGRHVRFLGGLSDGDLLEEYRRCAVVASASREETAGMVFQQAMAAGKSVLGTRVGGVPEIVEHEVTGLLAAAGDVGALAEGLRDLLGDPALRRRLGEAGRRVALRRFTASAAAEKTVALYRELVR